ncbi:GpE family phage tail protein [Escherichia coli]|nr:GpE family phage tail protein [Escherichia coli]
MVCCHRVQRHWSADWRKPAAGLTEVLEWRYKAIQRSGANDE